jgi:hypothetical protein
VQQPSRLLLSLSLQLPSWLLLSLHWCLMLLLQLLPWCLLLPLLVHWCLLLLLLHWCLLLPLLFTKEQGQIHFRGHDHLSIKL